MALSPYGRLLRLPGAPRMAGSALVLGTAGTMAPVSFVLFAHRATGSFAAASIVLAASTAGGLLAAPFRGRLIDRIGPSAAILRLALPSAATDVAFILAGHARAAAPLLIAVAFVAGAIIAPSTAAVAATAALSLVGGLAFATAPATRRRAPRASSRASPSPPSAAAFGTTFGALDIAFPAFARDHGSAAAAGALLAALAVGIGVGSFLTGLRPPASSAGRRYARPCGVAALGLLPLITTPALGLMAALATVAGLCFGPATTTQIGVLDEVAPPERPAEAFAWLAVLYGAGSAAGAALGGQLVEASGPRAAITAACAASGLAWIVTAARATTLSAPRARP